MSLFKMDKNYETILNPDAIKLCKYLPRITNDEFKYIVLAYDYTDGPYRLQPQEERKNLAKKKVFGDTDRDPETPTIKKAIEEYNSLIFDVRRETIDVYKTKIVKLQRESLDPELTFGKIKDIDAAMKFLMQRIEELQSEVNYEEKVEIVVRGDKKLSFIERWQLNMKRKKEQSF